MPSRRLCLEIVALGLMLFLAGGPAPVVAQRVAPGGAPPPGSGPVDVNGFIRPYDGDTFETWSDGGAAQHNVTLGASNTTYIATYDAPKLLVGDQTVQPTVDGNTAGMAEAFLDTATTGGTANKLFIYLDSTNTATQVVVGIYSNAAGDNPGTLLAQGTIASPTNGAWNSVAISPVQVTAGTKYWIALLGSAGGGTVQFRDGDSGGSAKVSTQTTLTTLPATWTTSIDYPNASMFGLRRPGPVGCPSPRAAVSKAGYSPIIPSGHSEADNALCHPERLRRDLRR